MDMKHCKQCGREFEGISRYCKNACRQKAYRNRNETATVTRQSVTPEPKCNKQILHPDIIARIDAIASGPEDWARRIKGAEDYARLFTNRPAYSEFARRMAQAGPGHVRVSKPGDDDYVCFKTEPRICWRCGKPTPSPLLDTHYNCTIEGRTQTVNTVVGLSNDMNKEGKGWTMASGPHTAPVVDEQQDKA